MVLIRLETSSLKQKLQAIWLIKHQLVLNKSKIRRSFVVGAVIQLSCDVILNRVCLLKGQT
jgi:hypothetical protein